MFTHHLYQTGKVSLLLLLFMVTQAHAQVIGRQAIALNTNWSFNKVDEKVPTLVNIPHTWNAVDVMDDTPGYYRGIGIYSKKLALKPQWKGKTIYLHFEGANQETSVYLNGKLMGSHIGGYNGFNIPLTNLKFNGADEIVVKVDNSYNENIAPLSADFTFFGGIYRNVWLVVVENTHFDDEKYAAEGVFVHAQNVSNQSAEVAINGHLKTQSIGKKLLVTAILTDANGKLVKEINYPIVAKNEQIDFVLPTITVNHPQLWSPEKPYLYQLTTKLLADETKTVLDEVKTKVGLRYFSFDAEKGFSLNGKPYKLIGASRHQDYAGMGNAVPTNLQARDVAMLKEMGGNFLRVAHYPQSQAILKACDELGILASVEIPVVNEITETEAFYRNCEQMQVEMIKQNYNHPSVIIWAYMNEVLLRMKFNQNPDRKATYIANIAGLAKRLDELTRATDPTRYTMIANHGDITGYIKAGLTQIPMLVGWNLYQGWYSGKYEDFGPALDRIHSLMPDKPLLITEYGADVDPRIHASNPVRFDKSLGYGLLYHQAYLKEILSRPFIAGAAAWNLSDFNSETREETMPHINNKGLLTISRKPKNTYYLYKAYFSKLPFVKIGDGELQLNGGIADDKNGSQTQIVQVFSNADSVTLIANGSNLGKKAVVSHVAQWEVPFVNGKNELKTFAMVKGQKIADQTSINFQLIPRYFTLTNFMPLYILMGSQRQFIDAQNQQVWLPSMAYQKGSWGHIDGEVFKVKTGIRQSYGTDKNIKGTPNDPIYQTQLEGISAYQLDVPKGKYLVTLHFAELTGNGLATNLPYNLDSLVSTQKEVPPQRIFDVYLNNQPIIKGLNIAAKYGVATAVKKQFNCVVTDEKGINLQFKSIAGKPVLNALSVQKLED